MVDFRKILVMLLFAAVAAAVVVVIVRIVKRTRTIRTSTTAESAQESATTRPVSNTASGPHIFITYESDGGLLEDGKCGWLDVECEDGEEKTYKLNFNKKAPEPIIVPLKNAAYRITYRTQSKAAMAASGVLNAINENNGAMGTFANAVYDAGGMNGKLESVVVRVENGFILRLACSTDGISKSCRIIG